MTNATDSNGVSSNGNSVRKSGKESSTYMNAEHGVSHEMYLNMYHGISNMDCTQISHYTEMTPDQKTTFEEFCEQVDKEFEELIFKAEKQGVTTTIKPDKLTCLRFLQSDKYNKNDAMKRLVANAHWAQEWKLHQVISKRPAKLELYRKLRARAYMGRTKPTTTKDGVLESGMPIFVERLGDFMSAIPAREGKQFTGEEYVQCFLYDLGLVLAKIRETYTETAANSTNDGMKATWKATWIIDCANISFYRAMKAISTIKLIDSHTEPNFPELAGPIYMIRVPSIVSGLWKVVKGFLDPAVVSKIEIHSNIPKDLFLKVMDESTLFGEYGGTNTSTPFPKAEYS